VSDQLHRPPLLPWEITPVPVKLEVFFGGGARAPPDDLEVGATVCLCQEPNRGSPSPYWLSYPEAGMVLAQKQINCYAVGITADVISIWCSFCKTRFATYVDNVMWCGSTVKLSAQCVRFLLDTARHIFQTWPLVSRYVPCYVRTWYILSVQPWFLWILPVTVEVRSDKMPVSTACWQPLISDNFLFSCIV